MKLEDNLEPEVIDGVAVYLCKRKRVLYQAIFLRLKMILSNYLYQHCLRAIATLNMLYMGGYGFVVSLFSHSQSHVINLLDKFLNDSSRYVDGNKNVTRPRVKKASRMWERIYST